MAKMLLGPDYKNVNNKDHPIVEINGVNGLFDLDHPFEPTWANFASITWYQIVAQPILWVSVISMTFLIPLDFFWFLL